MHKRKNRSRFQRDAYSRRRLIQTSDSIVDKKRENPLLGLKCRRAILYVLGGIVIVLLLFRERFLPASFTAETEFLDKHSDTAFSTAENKFLSKDSFPVVPDCRLKISTDMDLKVRKALDDRLWGALIGFFSGDALASPTHWYYGGQSQIISEYGKPITDYTQPNQHLKGSILNKSDPNGGGRLKKKPGFRNTSKKTIIGDVINHGKLPFWQPGKSFHYHATLKKGENTLEASIARVLMKSIVARDGAFDPAHFRQAYVKFMMTPGSHNDVYASTCHRMFFANLVFGGLDPADCPDNDQHNVDTIDGLVLPTIVALAGVGIDIPSDVAEAADIAEAAGACAGVTRKSGLLEDTARGWSQVIRSALTESDACFSDALDTFARRTIGRSPNPTVDDSSTMSACYLGQSLPGLIDLAAKYAPVAAESKELFQKDEYPVWEALLANANVGGENVHRGSILGAILGARAGFNELYDRMEDGLYEVEQLNSEIKDFVNAILPKDANDDDDEDEPKDANDVDDDAPEDVPGEVPGEVPKDANDDDDDDDDGERR